MKVVALTGQKGSGKSTVAKYLKYPVLKIAKPLKDMMRVLGLTDEHIEGNLKEVPTGLLCGKTPRHAMKTLGKDWRDTIAPELWLTHWLRQYKCMTLFSPNEIVLVDDMRFQVEVDFMRERFGENLVIAEIIRPETFQPYDEYEPKLIGVDHTIINDGSIDDLQNEARALLAQ